jgi:hypothetical protein
VITALKSYELEFIADGSSTTFVFDCSLTPINENFTGNLPLAILDPSVESTFTGTLSNVTAALVGTTVTFTFATPPPKFDNSSNLVVYTASFSLQFPN